MTPLSGWENFYVIVGSSAGALIGLQFVALALIAEMPARRGQEQAGAAFATPTVMHFSAVLLLSSILSAPWHDVATVAVVWSILGSSGVVYEIIVAQRMRMQKVYAPVFEDWLFHVLLPLVAYAILAGAGLMARTNVERALFAVGAAALLLLFIGIHNTWDAVVYHVFVRRQQEAEKSKLSK